MIFHNYFELSEVTEPSKTLHRWCCLSLLAGVVGTSVFVRHGNTKLYPNLYVVLLGTLSSKYPAAIELLKTIYSVGGKDVVVGDAQAIWARLEECQPADKILEAKMEGEIPDTPTFTNGITTVTKQLEILQDGWNHQGFLTTTGKSKKTVEFMNPRLNLLLSTTPDIFAQVFPSNNVNTHLLSQLIIINGGNPRKKIAWPLPYSEPRLRLLKEELSRVSKLMGEMTFSEDAKDFLTASYNQWVPIADSRLMSYASHRHIQLIKLSMLIAVEKFNLHISKSDVIEAAKILSFAEAQMPVALGEYGIDKQSHIRGRIMHLLNSRFPETSTLGDIFKAVQQDVKNYTEVADLVNSLIMAGKIVATNRTFAPVNQTGFYEQETMHLDFSTLWEGRP
jgi:hypothetical protein